MLPEDISTSTVLAVTKGRGVLGWYTVAVQQTFFCGCVSIYFFRTETYLDVISTLCCLLYPSCSPASLEALRGAVKPQSVLMHRLP